MRKRDNPNVKKILVKGLTTHFTEKDTQTTNKPRKVAQHHESSGQFQVKHCSPTQMAKLELERPRVREKVGRPELC